MGAQFFPLFVQTPKKNLNMFCQHLKKKEKGWDMKGMMEIQDSDEEKEVR